MAGSWDHNVRCWQIEQNGQTIPKAQQTAGGPVLDVCWSTDGSKVFTACGDKMARMWDLGSNQYVQIAAHDAPGKNGDGLSWMTCLGCTSCTLNDSWNDERFLQIFHFAADFRRFESFHLLIAVQLT